MKSLILKDLYNVGHHAKSMFFMLLIYAIIFVPFSGPETCIIVSGILGSMLVMTTFSYDDSSKWAKYAMVTPVTKQDLVAAKFIVLLIFSASCVITGLVLAFIGGMITHKVDYSNTSDVFKLLFIPVISLVIAEIFGSLSIPLLFKFGPEKARMLAFVALMIPAAICFGVYELLIFLGVSFTDQLVFILLCCSPVVALLWNLAMYKISYAIFSKKELLD
jgi:ABC-2 type transport system permease protein